MELFELHPIEVLHEHVSRVVSSWNENDGDFVILNTFMYIVRSEERRVGKECA